MKDELHINIKKLNGRVAILEIYDMLGRKLDEYDFKKEGLSTLNVRDYLPGIFFGVFHLENNDVIFKIMKQ